MSIGSDGISAAVSTYERIPAPAKPPIMAVS
jgi:hypothetical protein